MPIPVSKLLLLGRPDCHLCEEFEQELRAHPAASRIELEHADVDSRNGWHAEYGLRIPVLLDVEGALICEGRFDAAALERHLGGA